MMNLFLLFVYLTQNQQTDEKEDKASINPLGPKLKNSEKMCAYLKFI